LFSTPVAIKGPGSAMTGQRFSPWMRVVAFIVTISLFLAVAALVIANVFLGYGATLPVYWRNTLISVFIVETGYAFWATYYALFGLRREGGALPQERYLRLSLPDDESRLYGKTATVTLFTGDDDLGSSIERRIDDENGPYVSIALPPEVSKLLVCVSVNGRTYEGSCRRHTRFVPMRVRR